MEHLIASLMVEPLRLRPWEIRRLTDRQIADLYARRRDPQGRPTPPDEDLSHTDPLEQASGLAEAFGLTAKLAALMKEGAGRGPAAAATPGPTDRADGGRGVGLPGPGPEPG